jgi:hypothetical protein
LQKDRTESTRFLESLARGLGEEERLILCGFPGDPYEANMSAWKPHPWAVGRELPFGPANNAYVTVAAFGRAEDKTYRRRKETFSGGLALMVDDVGTPGDGSSSRVERSVVEGFPPSARVLTSPGNEQWWYFLEEPCRDAVLFDGLIRAFIAGKLLGADPGMSGITRVGRIPGFRNGKKKYGGEFVCELTELSDRRFTPQQLLDGFGLKVNGRNVQPKRLLVLEAAQERAATFLTTYKWLRQRGMLKRQDTDASGWLEMRCPWVDGHTNAVDNGAALAEPSDDNGYTGGFRCHHGTCASRGWKELTDWVNEQSIEELERANAAG